MAVINTVLLKLRQPDVWIPPVWDEKRVQVCGPTPSIPPGPNPPPPATPPGEPLPPGTFPGWTCVRLIKVWVTDSSGFSYEATIEVPCGWAPP